MKNIRRNVLRLCLALIVLFVGLGLYAASSFLGNWDRWLTSEYNVGNRAVRADVTAGDILDRNGVVLATVDADGNRVYQADETARRSVVHVVGDMQNNVNHGVESFMSRYLYGYEFTLEEQLAAQEAGSAKGDNVFLTIDANLCAYIDRVFSASVPEATGAVVVLNYKTGETLADMSFPNYDPLNVTSQVKNSPLKPFWNRAVQMQKASGSTFKIITAAAALDNYAGMDAMSTVYTCDGRLKIGDRYITDAGTDGVGEGSTLVSHGSLSLRRAFALSCNNTFAYIAGQLGDRLLRKEAEKFGFNDNFLFNDIVCENSVYPVTNRTALEVAWTGAGQSALLTTPLHMCMVAASVANDGVMMEPKLVRNVVSQTGILRKTMTSKVYRTVMEPAVAAILKSYMREVVTNGTGSKAAVNGHIICGKTGSSERDDQTETDAWFVGFIDEAQSPYAVCVVVENAGGGGSVSAPIARQIFQYLLNH